MRDAFLANPNVDVVFSAAGAMITGAVRAAKASGLTLGEGGSEIAAPGIKDGLEATNVDKLKPEYQVS
jgi:ABC-type sugar transport system substrate-binding protein